MTFQIKLVQSGTNLDVSNTQRSCVVSGLVRASGIDILGSIKPNAIQIPSTTKNTETKMYSKQFWENFARVCNKRIDHIITLNNLKPGDVITGYWDYEPQTFDGDNDGEVDDNFMQMDFDANQDIRILGSVSMAEIRYSIIKRGFIPDIGVWSLGKAPRGNPTDGQIHFVNQYMNVVASDNMILNGYPYIHATDDRWTPEYLANSWRGTINSWAPHQPDRPLWIAFQSRSRHKKPLHGEEVYNAFKYAASDPRVTGVLWWMQAETNDDLGYWESLNKICYSSIVNGVREGIAIRPQKKQ